MQVTLVYLVTLFTSCHPCEVNWDIQQKLSFCAAPIRPDLLSQITLL